MQLTPTHIPLPSSSLPFKQIDQRPDPQFKQLIEVFVVSERHTFVEIQRFIHHVNRLITTGKVHPSVHQLASYWYRASAVLFRDGRNRQSLDCLLLCVDALPPSEPFALIHAHTLLALVALHEGLFEQCLLSQGIASSLMQQQFACGSLDEEEAASA